MKVVVTGFQPFGKETLNPSFEAVRLLPDEIKGAQIVKKEIPVVFRKGGQTVQEIVRAEKPDIVIPVSYTHLIPFHNSSPVHLFDVLNLFADFFNLGF